MRADRQYGLDELSRVFTLGLLLGFVKLKSGSTLPAIVSHAVANLIATNEAALHVGSS